MNGEFVKKPGRPVAVPKERVFELLERHIGDIFQNKSESLVSKHHPIWKTLAQEFQNLILPTTVYNYGCQFIKQRKSNQDGDGLADESYSALQSDANSTINEANSTLNNSSLVFDQDIHIEIPLKKIVFMSMTERYKVKCAGRKGGYRDKIRFIPGEYTDKIFGEIVVETSLRCAFKIENTHVSLNYDNGYIKAYCKCGSDLRININFDKDPKQVVLDCIIRLGTLENCGDILLIEVVNSQNPKMMSKTVSLKNILKRVLSPTGNGTELRLLGAIAYTGPSKITASRQQQISHYTAVCLRNDWWYEYDDNFPSRKKYRSNGAKIVPELLIYSQIL